MSALRSILASFDISINTAELDAGQNKIGKFIDGLKGVGVAMAGLAAVKGFVSFAEGVAAAAREVEWHAARMEMGVTAYQRLSQVAQNYGVGVEQVQIATTLFTRALGNAGGIAGILGHKTGHAAQAFKSLGLNAAQFRGQKLEDILPQIADAFVKIEDPMERLTTGLNLVGHRGRAILPMLAQGGDELRRQFAAAIPVFEEATITTANRAAIAGKTLGRVWQNLLNNSLGKAAMEIFARVAEKLTVIVRAVKELTKSSEIGKGVLIALGTAMAAAAVATVALWGPVVLIIGAVALAFAALALMIDDFIVFMRGGDSVFGDWMDEIFGPGGAEKVQQDIKDVWEGLKQVVATVTQALGSTMFHVLLGTANTLAGVLKGIIESMQWIAKHMPGSEKVDPAGPADQYGWGAAGNAGLPGGAAHAYPGLANIPVPYTVGVDHPSVDHRPTPAEVAKGITFNMVGSIDRQQFVEDMARAAEKTMNASQEKGLRDAISAAGGAK